MKKKIMWVAKNGNEWDNITIKKYEKLLYKENGFHCRIVPFMSYRPEGQPIINIPNDVRHYLDISQLFVMAK